MSTLQSVIDRAVADAFYAGAEWQAVVRQGEDSAQVGREANRWRDDERYKRALRQRQQAATEAVSRALVRMRLEPKEQQGQLFGEGDAS